MSGNYFSNAGVFLIQALFSLFILAVMLRLLLQWSRANFYNPISQLLVKMTNPMLVPLRRVIPGLGGIDLASVILLIALQTTQLALIALLLGQSPHIAGLLILTVAKLLYLLLNVFLFSILIQVILSWIRPGDHNPFSDLLYSLNEPLLAPARRFLPSISGIDFSPILVMLGLQLLIILVVAPLSDMGQTLS